MLPPSICKMCDLKTIRARQSVYWIGKVYYILIIIRLM